MRSTLGQRTVSWGIQLTPMEMQDRILRIDRIGVGGMAEYRLHVGIGGNGKWPLAILIKDIPIEAETLARAILKAESALEGMGDPAPSSRACLMNDNGAVSWSRRLPKPAIDRDVFDR